MKIWRSGLLLVAALIWAVTPVVVWSQNVYGRISGIVSDSSGASIDGATVSLTNLDTNVKQQIATTSSGNYAFVNILPGRYRIQAEKSGFKNFVREPILVQVESGLKVDIVMPVGAASETVEVTGEAPLLQPETNSLGQVIEQRTVTDLPLNGRNPIALAELVPGVVPQGQPSAGNSSTGNPVGANPFALGDFQMGGGMAGQSQILIDGVPTNGAYLNVVTVIPTQDAIQEFKVQTNNLGPEYGRFAGGVINLSTKPGTNKFHGSFYEFIRNRVLNANDFFDNRNGVKRPPFTQNQFGVNGGGPIVHDKLFFFGAYEGFRLRQGHPFQTFVPTDAERNGDFSTIGSTGRDSVFDIYDPMTSGANGNPACDSSNAVCRTQFAGNIIPANRIDPTAQALLKYFPAPTPGLENSTTGNFATSFSSGGNTTQYNGRIDYTLGQRQRIFGRYTYSNILSLPDAPFGQICGDRCTESTKAHQVSLGDTVQLTSMSILDLHFGYTRYVYLRTPLSEGIDLSAFGPNWKGLTDQMTYTHIPQVCVSEASGDSRWGAGSWCAQGTGSGIGAFDDTYSFEPAFSKIAGKHTLKIGMEYRILRNNYYQSNNPAGLFQFDAGMTAKNPVNPNNGTVGKDASAGGNGFASFLLGYGNNGNVTEPARTADQNLYTAVYAGDTWNFTRKITLNLGARLDLQGDWTERHDRNVAANPTEASPLLKLSPQVAAAFPGLKGGFDLVASDRHKGRTPFSSWNHVSPRIGISYQFDPNTVVRTGYGMFYLPVDVRWNDAPHNLFINSFSTPWLTTQADGVTPKATLYNPFPSGITPPFGRNQGLIDVQGNGIEAPSSNNPAPYVQQWNLDIQRQFHGDFLVDIAYAGSKGTHLPMHDQTLNQLLPQDLPKTAQDVEALTAQVTNPFAGNCSDPTCTGPVMSGGVGSNATVKHAQLLLPFPQYDNYSVAEPDNRDSIYHSMQLKMQKRFAAGAQILATYTIAKLIDNTNSEINWLEAAAPGWGDANAYNLRGERSLDGFDVPQRLVIGSILDLPVGKGKAIGGNMSGVADKIAGGWGINTIITFQAGYPIIVGGCPGALSSSGIPNVGCARPTRTALSHLTSGSKDTKLAHWYDTSVFTAGDPNNFGYGTDSRTEPNIRADGQKNFDFAAFKNTKFGPDGRFAFEFRGEFFNLFNRTQFSPPAGWGSNIGQVTGQYNLPRVVQFAGRVTF